MWNLKSQINTYKQRAEWWLPGAGRWGNEEVMVKGYRVAVNRMNKSRDLMHSMMTIVNNTILNTGCLLRE